MNLKKLTTIVLNTIIIMISCDNSSDYDQNSILPVADSLPPVSIWLSAVDTIDLCEIDDDCIFTMSTDFTILRNGDIAIIDDALCAIRIYDRNTLEYRMIGQQGYGPGEFLAPTSISPTHDGGFVVSDVIASRVCYYDSTYIFSNVITCNYPYVPLSMHRNHNNYGMICKYIEYESHEGQLFGGYSISRVDSLINYEFTYYKSIESFNPNDFAGLERTQIQYAVDINDNIIIAPYSNDKYTILRLSPSGDTLAIINQDHEVVPKTETEIQNEVNILNDRMVARGVPTSLISSYEPNPNKQIISGIFVDSRNRIWVQSGLYATPVFDVYSIEPMEILFKSAICVPSTCNDIIVRINEYGIATLVNTQDDEYIMYIYE